MEAFLRNKRLAVLMRLVFMRTRIRYSAVAALLISLALTAGCNRPSARKTQPNQPASAEQQNATPQSPANQSDNGGRPATSSPTIANSQNDAPPNASASNTANPAPAPEALIIPAGTSVVVRLQQSLSSASAVSGERFEAVLDRPLVVDNQVVVPVGTPVTGHVVVAHRSGRLRHPGEIGLTLDSVVLGQQSVPIRTSSVIARGGSHKKRNLGWIGGGTGGGALIGALAGGGKGALIGGGIGAVAGTTTALLTGKKDVTLGAERRLTFRLHRDVSLQT
jgi:hypothetical protein